jgi:hypothetical protein
MASTNLYVPERQLHGLRNIILFGDSHATQWMPALNQIGLKNDFKITMFTKAGCPASDLYVLYEIAQDKLIKYPECAIWRQNTLAEINRMPEPELIVLAASSKYNDGSDPKRNFDYWVKGYQSTFVSLQKYIDKIIILNDTPHAGFPEPLDCLGKNLTTPSNCDLTYSQVVTPLDRMEALTQISNEYKIPIVDPISWLCNQSICPAVLDGIPAYVDASHLSAQMSEHLAPLLEQSILSKLNG